MMISPSRLRSPVSIGIVLLAVISSAACEMLRADDSALRSLLGVSSLKVDLPTAQEDRYYAVAVGQFEGGKFLGYALRPQMGLSLAHTPGRFVEFAWHQQGDAPDCVLVADGLSRASGQDQFISKFKGMTKQVSGASEGMGEFQGFRVLSYMAAVPADSDTRAPLHSFEQTTKEFPTVALLYQEFSKRSDYLAFVEKIEKTAGR